MQEAPLGPTRQLARSLERERERLDAMRTRVEARLTVLDEQADEARDRLRAIDERRRVLGSLLASPGRREENDSSDRTGHEAEEVSGLRGRDLRQVAAAVLYRRVGHLPVHYRDWFTWVLEEGHAVGGRDPLASFLTNISRSPVVVRAQGSGIYQVDRDAPRRLATELSERRAELADLLRLAAREPARSATLAADRRDLSAAIRRLERLEAEARAVVGDETMPHLRRVS